mgnify:FL=1
MYSQGYLFDLWVSACGGGIGDSCKNSNLFSVNLHIRPARPDSTINKLALVSDQQEAQRLFGIDSCVIILGHTTNSISLPARDTVLGRHFNYYHVRYYFGEIEIPRAVDSIVVLFPYISRDVNGNMVGYGQIEIPMSRHESSSIGPLMH